MSNTNFQTFHQMGQAINEVVRQATGRDNVQNIDMEHITVAQNHYYQDVDVSGRVVSFHAGAAGLPLEKCVVQIEPVQEGSGDPSPDNVRPITGWTGAQVYVSPTTDAADGQTYTIAFPAEAGTVYGGTLDAVSGELVVDWVYNTFNGSENWFGFSLDNPQKGYYYIFLGDLGYVVNNAIICDQYKQARISVSNSVIGINVINSEPRSKALLIFRPNQDGRPLDEFKVWLAENPVSCAYKITSPTTYHLTPTEITTLLGVNNIWSDAGDIEVKFKDLKELY